MAEEELPHEVEAELSDEAHRARAALNLWIGYRNHLRAKARELGYALGLHGSVKRDVDLIAFPWTEDAAGPDELIEALCAQLVGVQAYVRRDKDGAIDWALRPHGRRAATVHVVKEWYKGTYLDISVAPLLRGAVDP